MTDVGAGVGRGELSMLPRWIVCKEIFIEEIEKIRKCNKINIIKN
jgi:hypothetical protein